MSSLSLAFIPQHCLTAQDSTAGAWPGLASGQRLTLYKEVGVPLLSVPVCHQAANSIRKCVT